MMLQIEINSAGIFNGHKQSLTISEQIPCPCWRCCGMARQGCDTSDKGGNQQPTSQVMEIGNTEWGLHFKCQRDALVLFTGVCGDVGWGCALVSPQRWAREAFAALETTWVWVEMWFFPPFSQHEAVAEQCETPRAGWG